MATVNDVIILSLLRKGVQTEAEKQGAWNVGTVCSRVSRGPPFRLFLLPYHKWAHMSCNTAPVNTPLIHMRLGTLPQTLHPMS